MSVMRPKQYLDRYTTLKIPDPRTGVTLTVPMTGYGSGWDDDELMLKENPDAKPKGNRGPLGPICQAECNGGFGQALRHAYDPNKHKSVPAAFHFTEGPLYEMFKGEQFFKMSYIRAFGGKGSPDEIIDTLRLALAIGRIGMDKDLAGKKPAKPTLQEYVKLYFTLDCNGLTGNYYGIHPSWALKAYADPKKARKTPQDVKIGDVVVTVKPTGKCKHVALIDEYTLIAGASKSPKCNLTVAEWGSAGDEDAHYNAAHVTIEKGPDAKFGIGWKVPSGNFRYIFAPPETSEPRGWGLNGDQTK